MPKIIDTADTMTSSKLSALKKAGVETIIRCDDRRPRGGWHPAEAKLIRDAGLRLGIVYEDAATVWYFTRLEGIRDSRRQSAGNRMEAPSISRSTSIQLQQPLLAGELVAQNVDLIATFGDPAIRAAQRATQAIPIVGITDDMAGSGPAASLTQIDNVASRKYPGFDALDILPRGI